jgi:hypothetical protein
MWRFGETGWLRVEVGAAFLTGMMLVLVLTHDRTGGRATAKRIVSAMGAEASLLPAPTTVYPVIGGAARFFPDGAPSLDRIAAAVDAAESNYGTNPRMRRADPDGPQGPMQLTAAAAADVGGGDRFDPSENLALGRAYLARLYRRYGRWADAVAAYNWGPRHMDAWIHQGRRGDRLPAAVARYTGLVLLAAASPGVQLPDPNVPALSFTRHQSDPSSQPREASRHEGVAGADGPFIPVGAGNTGMAGPALRASGTRARLPFATKVPANVRTRRALRRRLAPRRRGRGIYAAVHTGSQRVVNF